MLRILTGLAIAAAALPAAAQDNLDRGRTAQQIYGTNCAVCHANPRGLGAGVGPRGLVGFLSQHYTTSQNAARALAAYLIAAGAGERRQGPQRRRPRAESSGKRRPPN